MGARAVDTPDLLDDLAQLERMTKALAARANAEGMRLEFDTDDFGFPLPCLVRVIYAAQPESTEH